MQAPGIEASGAGAAGKASDLQRLIDKVRDLLNGPGATGNDMSSSILEGIKDILENIDEKKQKSIQSMLADFSNRFSSESSDTLFLKMQDLMKKKEKFNALEREVITKIESLLIQVTKEEMNTGRLVEFIGELKETLLAENPNLDADPELKEKIATLFKKLDERFSSHEELESYKHSLSEIKELINVVAKANDLDAFKRVFLDKTQHIVDALQGSRESLVKGIAPIVDQISKEVNKIDQIDDLRRDLGNLTRDVARVHDLAVTIDNNARPESIESIVATVREALQGRVEEIFATTRQLLASMDQVPAVMEQVNMLKADVTALVNDTSTTLTRTFETRHEESLARVTEQWISAGATLDQLATMLATLDQHHQRFETAMNNLATTVTGGTGAALVDAVGTIIDSETITISGAVGEIATSIDGVKKSLDRAMDSIITTIHGDIEQQLKGLPPAGSIKALQDHVDTVAKATADLGPVLTSLLDGKTFIKEIDVLKEKLAATVSSLASHEKIIVDIKTLLGPVAKLHGIEDAFVDLKKREEIGRASVLHSIQGLAKKEDVDQFAARLGRWIEDTGVRLENDKKAILAAVNLFPLKELISKNHDAIIKTIADHVSDLKHSLKKEIESFSKHDTFKNLFGEIDKVKLAIKDVDKFTAITDQASKEFSDVKASLKTVTALVQDDIKQSVKPANVMEIGDRVNSMMARFASYEAALNTLEKHVSKIVAESKSTLQAHVTTIMDQAAKEASLIKLREEMGKQTATAASQASQAVSQVVMEKIQAAASEISRVTSERIKDIEASMTKDIGAIKTLLAAVPTVPMLKQEREDSEKKILASLRALDQAVSTSAAAGKELLVKTSGDVKTIAGEMATRTSITALQDLVDEKAKRGFLDSIKNVVTPGIQSLAEVMLKEKAFTDHLQPVAQSVNRIDASIDKQVQAMVDIIDKVKSLSVKVDPLAKEATVDASHKTLLKFVSESIPKLLHDATVPLATGSQVKEVNDAISRAINDLSSKQAAGNEISKMTSVATGEIKEALKNATTQETKLLDEIKSMVNPDAKLAFLQEFKNSLVKVAREETLKRFEASILKSNDTVFQMESQTADHVKQLMLIMNDVSQLLAVVPTVDFFEKHDTSVQEKIIKKILQDIKEETRKLATAASVEEIDTQVREAFPKLAKTTDIEHGNQTIEKLVENSLVENKKDADEIKEAILFLEKQISAQSEKITLLFEFIKRLAT